MTMSELAAVSMRKMLDRLKNERVERMKKTIQKQIKASSAGAVAKQLNIHPTTLNSYLLDQARDGTVMLIESRAKGLGWE